MKDLSLIVHTCDDYSFLWDNFLILFDKYWDSTIDCDKYFLSNTKTPHHPNFKGLVAGHLVYSDRLIYALNQINTQFVLILQDDYFLRRILTKETLDDYMFFINQNNADVFGIKEMSNYYSLIPYENFKRKTQHSEYTASMQATIWNTEFLKKHLLPGETIWDFEINGTNRINATEHKIFCDILNDPWYLEVVRKGQYRDDFYNLVKMENLIYENSNTSTRGN